MLLPDSPILRVGDRLRIVCPEAPSICVERIVGADGTIEIPGIGAAPAAVRRAEEIALWIAARLPLTLTTPWVEVRRVGTSPGLVSIEGAVRHPLQLFAPRGIAFQRLLTAAEPLSEADQTLLSYGRRIRGGTTVVVPTTVADRRINVVGAVAKPSALPPADRLLLASALDAAGGLTVHADPNAIVVIRHGEAIPLRLPADANFTLQPGDLVRVGLAVERKYVVVQGLVNRPGSVEFATGMTVKAVLAAAGGVLPEAVRGNVIWNTGPKSYRLSLPFLMEGRIPDPVMGANDSLIVEARP